MASAFREARWLMIAGHASPDRDRLRELAAAAFDWRRLAARAEFERAFPVIADRIRESGVHPPADVATLIASRALMAEFAIARLHAMLEGVAGCLAAGGIDVLLLKGAALARTRYPHRRLRPMGDLDLLIRPSQLHRARALLIEQGWRTALAEIDGAYDQHHHLPPLHDPQGAGARLELHGDLFFTGHPFRFGAPAMWRAAVPHPVGSAAAWVPCARHLLLHACIHFSWGHMMREGAWTAMRDVAILARAPELDWDALAREARTAKAGTACYWTLFMAARLGDAGIPHDVLRSLAPPLPGAVRRRVANHFAARILGAARAPERLERAVWSVAMRPKWSGHGAVRPWDHDAEFDATHAGPLPAAPKSAWKERSDRLVRSARCVTSLALGRSLPL